MNREQLIEARAKYLWETNNPGGSWEACKKYCPTSNTPETISKATADVDWFLSHGMIIPVEAKIPENPYHFTEWDEIPHSPNGKPLQDENVQHIFYGKSLKDLKRLNPSGLYTKGE
jgi:hypothetical protein